ncbi:MAG: hypothetical protein E7225_06465 [Clostridiales bacterium]|nr:hypothetical protein [Clostridiales bacterium]
MKEDLKNLTYYVYKHTFPNGKVYIGITKKNPEKRWQRGYGYITQKPMWDAILEFGWDNIKHEILYEGLSEEEARKKEHFLIARNKSVYGQNGYNSTTGGFESRTVYDIRFEMPILKLNQEGKIVEKYDRLEDAAKELSLSPIKLLDVCINNGERKKLLRGSHPVDMLDRLPEKEINELYFINGFMWEYEERIVQYSMNGEFVAEYHNSNEATRATGIKNIYRCCNGRVDTPSAGGYVWRYVAHSFDRFPVGNIDKKKKL